MSEPETRAERDPAPPPEEPSPAANAAADSSTSTQEAAASPSADAPSTATSAKEATRKGISGFVWAAVILTLLLAELYTYGHNGHIRVCVGRKGITDFAQLDKPRKSNMAAGYPFCVENLNLGMYSRSDEVAKEALDVACSRAATLLRGEKSECIRRDKDWIRRVDKSNVAPWDPRFYKRLFFLE